MQLVWQAFLAFLICVPAGHAASLLLDQNKRLDCRPIWGPTFGSPKPGRINTTASANAGNMYRDRFVPLDGLQVIIFNIQDEPLLSHDSRGRISTCTQDMVSKNLCKEADLNKVAITNDTGGVILARARAPIIYRIYNLTQPGPSPETMLNYSVPVSGFYCVYITLVGKDADSEKTFWTLYEFQNAFGLLPPVLYPALPFYSTITLVYLVIALIWGFGCYRYWADLLAIQKYVTGVLVFLVIDNAFNYLLYANYNATGELSKVLLGITVVLSSARNAVSWFMLLIVSLGYGVLRPTLGKAMKFCHAMAVAFFLANVLYSAGSLLAKEQENEDPIQALIITLPLSLMITSFYSWTLSALAQTMKTLADGKQAVKLSMYKSLTWILATSIVLVFIALVLNVVFAIARQSAWYMDTAWTYQWFLFDGYFNLVYLFVFVSISFLWRPTSENQRYGLSQLASDESEADGHYAMEVVFGNGDDELGLDGEPDEDLEAGDDVMKWVEENILAAGGPDAEDEEAQRQAVHRALADEEEVEDLVPRKR